MVDRKPGTTSIELLWENIVALWGAEKKEKEEASDSARASS